MSISCVKILRVTIPLSHIAGLIGSWLTTGLLQCLGNLVIASDHNRQLTDPLACDGRDHDTDSSRQDLEPTFRDVPLEEELLGGVRLVGVRYRGAIDVDDAYGCRMDDLVIRFLCDSVDCLPGSRARMLMRVIFRGPTVSLVGSSDHRSRNFVASPP